MEAGFCLCWDLLKHYGSDGWRWSWFNITFLFIYYIKKRDVWMLFFPLTNGFMSVELYFNLFEFTSFFS